MCEEGGEGRWVKKWFQIKWSGQQQYLEQNEQ